ncbi:MAG: hypothetical protein ACYDG2_24585 [Ruminiclostridium sp.]
MNKSKAKVVINSIILMTQVTVGICSTIFGLIGVLGSIYYPDIRIISIVFICVGVLLMYFSNKRRKLANTFKIYVQKLSFSNTGSIKNLAIELGSSEDIIIKNLKLLIYKKFFVDAYIDFEQNRVVFPSSTVQTNTQQNINQAKIEYMAIACKNCGGVSKIQKRTVGECDYCGSPIQ